MTGQLVRTFRHGDASYRGVSHPGFIGARPDLSQWLEPRGLVRFNLRAGDLVQLESNGSRRHPIALAFTPEGGDGLSSLNLSVSEPADVAVIEPSTVDSAPLIGWLTKHGVATETPLEGRRLALGTEPTVLRAGAALTLWLALPATTHDLVSGKASGAVHVQHQPAPSNAPLLPPALGDVRDEFTIPRGTAMAYQLAAGESVQIIDVEGQQCSDFTAFRSAGLHAGREEMIDGTVTRSMARGAYPLPGLFDKYYDSAMRPMLRVAQDTVGRHDTFALACTARGYEERGFPGHLNCSDNISNALAPFGVAPRPAWPAINLFFNSWIDAADNRLQSDEAWSRAGDYVIMTALDDVTCVSTACPDDIDPINGWNPTDVHVRIYREKSPIRRAIAYRERAGAMAELSEETAFHPRTSQLTRQFHPARNLWVPSAYTATGAIGEYWACREAATLQDTSSLRKYDIKGPDAERLLQHVLTRDIARVPVHRGTYALICDETGQVVDDGTLFRLAPDLFRWCCGSEDSERILSEHTAAQGLRVRVEAMRGAMPSLALQGPASRDILRRVVYTSPHTPSLDDLKWFGMTLARLGDREGPLFMLTRTGYTGELGYELFMTRADALTIWDGLMEAGAPLGLTPMGGEALNILRIEAGLMAADAEFAPGVDAWEAGLGFTLSMKKTDFVGRAALERNSAAPRRTLVGLLLDGDDVPSHGDPVLVGERPVGVITSAVRSPTLERAIAMARVAVEYAAPGTELTVGRLDGHMKRLSATTTTIPFVDPERKRPRA